MPFEDRKFLEAFRTLLLPISSGQEKTALDAAFAYLSESGVEIDDIPKYIEIELDIWREDKPGSIFKQSIQSAIGVSHSEPHIKLATSYFELHSLLQNDDFMMSFDQASAFLSHGQLIIDLANESNMSASLISNMLNTRDQRVPFSRQSVSLLLRKIGLIKEVHENDIVSLFNEDRLLSERFFADADLANCRFLVNRVAQRLCGESNIDDFLEVLAPPEDISRFTPYIQMLHYQCSLSEYFDFAVKDMYEFKPRGRAANTLFGLYPDSLVSAANPFLNNAKSVEQLTPDWVRSKKGKEPPGAAALYNILNTLQSLGFSARQELCSWIRMWIHRVILLASVTPTELPTTPSDAQLDRLLNFVQEGNTGTSGVVEQRLVDAVAVSIHSVSRDWRPRGLEDSVNTTNVSQSKLGDCDFQNPIEHCVKAYEAHGGKLTSLYIQDHIRSLKKVLPKRIREWEAFSEVEGWNVEVEFIAHEISAEVGLEEFEFEGVKIVIKAVCYKEFFERVSREELRPNLERFVLRTLSENRVPESTRKIVRTQMLGDQ